MLCNGVAALITSDDSPIIQQLQQQICRSQVLKNRMPFPKQLLENILYLNKNVDQGQQGPGEKEGVSAALESIAGWAGVMI